MSKRVGLLLLIAILLPLHGCNMLKDVLYDPPPASCQNPQYGWICTKHFGVSTYGPTDAFCTADDARADADKHNRDNPGHDARVTKGITPL